MRRNALYDHVHDAMAKNDPLRLIEQGAPRDEYDAEIPNIIRFLEKSPDAETLAAHIYKLYRDKLAPDFDIGPFELYKAIAHQIIESSRTPGAEE